MTNSLLSYFGLILLILLGGGIAYLLDLRRWANLLLVVLYLMRVSLPHFDLPQNINNLLLISLAILILLLFYFGRNNRKVSLIGSLATGATGFFISMVTDKMTLLDRFDNEKPLECPKDLVYAEVKFKQTRLELYHHKDSLKKSLLYVVHGGGHVKPITNLYRKLCHRYARLFPDTLVACVDPRSAADHPYPAPLDDVVDGYEYLLSNGFNPESTVLLADSAGGNLALALCHRLKACGQALPKAEVLLSPQSDMTQSGKSYITRYHLDPILGNMAGSAEPGKTLPVFYAKGEDLENPFISPLLGDLHDFPDTLIQVGECEILYDDSKQLYEKMKASDVKVEFKEFPGMIHGFQISFSSIVPEVRRANSEIKAFLANYL